ncbi:MAG: transposase family protein [Clostridiales bacterium]|nr:transposase family protein [Clostridiales bacterium]
MSAVRYREAADCSFSLDRDHFVYKLEEDEREIRVYIKSKPHSCACPDCGTLSDHLHATYERKLQDIPIRGKRTYLFVNVYKYECPNASCATKVFMEELSFAGLSQVRTDALNAMVYWFGEFFGNRDASRLLGQLGVKASQDTVRRLRLKKKDGRDPRFQLAPGKEGGRNWIEILRECDDIRLGGRERAGAYIAAVQELLPDYGKDGSRSKLLGKLPEDIRHAIEQ